MWSWKHAVPVVSLLLAAGCTSDGNMLAPSPNRILAQANSFDPADLNTPGSTSLLPTQPLLASPDQGDNIVPGPTVSTTGTSGGSIAP